MLASGGRLGPAGARNVGVDAAQGEIVFFVDADVVVHADVFRRAALAFEEDAQCVAVFGSYDDRPSASGFVSQYVNLRHHSVHQAAEEEAETFWAGCGAVRRSAFLEAGGYDGERYAEPSIEDIELGQRLRARGGRILVDKAMQATHLKHWSLRTMLATDIFKRALPWARLLRLSPTTRVLNVGRHEQLKAACAVLLSTSLVVGVFLHEALYVAVAALLVCFWMNRRLCLLLMRQQGLLHMVVGFLLHLLYFHYCTVVYLYSRLEPRHSARGA